MSAQLMLAYPDIFKGAGLLNGGLPGTASRLESEYQPMMEMQDNPDELYNAKEIAYDKT